MLDVAFADNNVFAQFEAGKAYFPVYFQEQAINNVRDQLTEIFSQKGGGRVVRWCWVNF